MANGFPSKESVALIRERYPAGCRVELASLNDPYAKIRPGDQGTVEFVDDTATVFIAWDCGSHLGAVYGEDKIRRL